MPRVSTLPTESTPCPGATVYRVRAVRTYRVLASVAHPLRRLRGSVAIENEVREVELPAPGMTLTRLLVISDLERARAWYENVLGAEVQGEYGGTSCVLRFLDGWLLLVTGGPPTADKPGVTFEAPVDPDHVNAELIIGVPDCRAAYALLSARGAAFLAPPVEYAWEIRAFFRDPDGHLFEISQHRGSD